MPTRSRINIYWVFYTSLKYLVSSRKKKLHFFGLSVAGITTGLIAVIVIIGIMNGLQTGYLNDIIEIDSYHLRVYLEEDDWDENLIADLKEHEEISAAFPFYELQAIITANGKSVPCLIKGIHSSDLLADRSLHNELELIAGSYPDEQVSTITIGRKMSAELGRGLNSAVQLMVIGEGKTVNFVPIQQEMVIGGVFNAGYPEIDSYIVFCAYEFLETLQPRTNPVIGIKLKDFTSQDLHKVEQHISSLPGVSGIETWKEKNSSLYSALMLEKYSMFLILSLIFLVIGINIKNSLERLIFMQRHDIGVLMAIGAEKRKLIFVFLLQGLMVACSGIITGVILGVLLSNNINDILHGLGYVQQQITGNVSLFLQYSFPVIIMPSEILYVSIFIIFVCIAAAGLAVRQLTSIEPVRILHYE